MADPKFIQGARVRLYIGEKAIGYCSGVDGEETIDYEPVNVINQIKVVEFIPVAYRCSMSATIFRVVGETLKSKTLGSVFPDNSTRENILTSGDLNGRIENDIEKINLYSVYGMKAASQNFRIESRGIVSTNANFVAISFLDETQQG